MKKEIGVFVGSLRKASYTSAIAGAAMAMAPDQLGMKTINIGNLAMFNQDYDDENNPPREWEEFRSMVSKLDGFLFVTPEYNRSLPPVLKNAIDIGSRPQGKNLWSGKPGGIISVSPGSIGGFGANHHLRQVLSCLNVYTMNYPETYVSNVADSLDQEGNLTSDRTRDFLQRYITFYANWIEKFSAQ